MENGFFITFEGGEGVGKTTQIKKLAEFLVHQGLSVVQTREPGGTPHAEAIRSLLSDDDLGPDWNPTSEALLMSAARAMHVQNVIEPALAASSIVLCDRFIDSTWVYQGIIQKQDPAFIETLIEKSTKGLMPDLTLVFDLPGEVGMKRVQARGARDHYDNQDAAFYEDIRQGFLTQAEAHPERCIILNADQDIEGLAHAIQSIVMEHLSHV